MARRTPNMMGLMHPGSLLMLAIRVIQFILAIAALGVTGSLVSAVKGYFQYLEFDDDFGLSHKCSVPGGFDYNIFCVRIITSPPSSPRSNNHLGRDHHPRIDLPRRVGQIPLPHYGRQVFASCHRRLLVHLLARGCCHGLDSVPRGPLRYLWIPILPGLLR